MIVIRPPGILTTPRNLKDALGYRRTLSADSITTVDWSRDFFLFYPAPSKVRNADAKFSDLHDFQSSNKCKQREALAAFGLPIPRTSRPGRRMELAPEVAPPVGGRKVFVARPLRHRAGQGWRLTEDPTAFDPREEYLQELYPKRHEYRLIYFKGRLVSTLLKRVPEGLARDQPWNHANGSSFVTVEHEENNRLRNTDIYQRLSDVPIIKSAHLVGVDVLLGKRQDGYVITEFNFCPAITIPATLERISEYARH